MTTGYDGHPDLRLCIDRVVPPDYHPARATLERATTEALPLLDNGATPIMARLALSQLKMWENGRELRCRFLDGDTKQKRKVEAKAHLWERFANVTFAFVTSTDEDIRISFTADSGSWSALGTDCLVTSYFPRYQPTMNFGWLSDDTPDQEYERVVVHEFGHALGAIHEHQSPAAKLKWNKAEVYRVFSGPPNHWSKADIDSNILEHYSQTHMNFTNFDPDSIMLYAFPANLFSDHHATAENTHLSAGDEHFIAHLYPRQA